METTPKGAGATGTGWRDPEAAPAWGPVSRGHGAFRGGWRAGEMSSCTLAGEDLTSRV